MSFYREAARRVAEGEASYSCLAIAEQSKRYKRHSTDTGPAAARYVEAFADDQIQLQFMFMNEGLPAAQQNLRVMALLMYDAARKDL